MYEAAPIHCLEDGRIEDVSKSGVSVDVEIENPVVDDPLYRPGWPNWLIHTLVFTALLASGGYLFWRVVGSQNGAQPVMFWLLWGAEAFGLISLALHAHEVWVVPPARRKAPIDVPVDVVIATYDESPEVLEATFVGCSFVRGNVLVWVLDDGRREWVQAMAEDFGFKYVTRPDNLHAKAGNINHALPSLRGELLLILDADHVPDPSIVEAMTGYFIDPRVAVVQSPHFFRNRDSAAHSDLENHEQGLFFEVIEPARERLDAAFWAGSGALVRTEALNSIGGLPIRTITEDLESTLALQRAGWKTRYHHEHLLQGLAPQNLAGYVIQRQRWAIGTLNVLFGPNSPIFRSGFKIRTRLAYLSNLSYYLMPFQHLIFVGTLVTMLWTGWLPVGTIPIALIGAWFVSTTITVNAAYGLSRGYQKPFEGNVYAWAISSRFLIAWWSLITRKKVAFAVTPKDGTDEGGVTALRLLRFPLSCLIIVAVSITVRIGVQLYGQATGDWLLPRINPDAMPIITFFAVWQIIELARTLRRFTKHKQQRKLWRFPVDLEGTIDGSQCRVLDLNESGARVLMEREPGDTHELHVELDLLDGAGTQTAKGTFTPRSRVEGPDGWRVGGEVVWQGTDDRRAVIYETHVRAPFAESRHLQKQPTHGH